MGQEPEYALKVAAHVVRRPRRSSLFAELLPRPFQIAVNDVAAGLVRAFVEERVEVVADEIKIAEGLAASVQRFENRVGVYPFGDVNSDDRDFFDYEIKEGVDLASAHFVKIVSDYAPRRSEFAVRSHSVAANQQIVVRLVIARRGYPRR